MTKRSNSGPRKIGDLFETYKKRLRAPVGSVVIAAHDVIADVCGISLPESALLYTPRTKTLVIHASGMAKSEILFHKDEIITHLKGRLGAGNAPTTIL
jgi:hypothetical protein